MQSTIPSCGEYASALLPGAEKELAAYASAVRELFGPDQALLCVEDWMEELGWMNWPPDGRIPDWRCLTITAAKRLANRLSVPGVEQTAALSNLLRQGVTQQQGVNQMQPRNLAGDPL